MLKDLGRSLSHFRRSHLAVGAGAAVASAVLTGALIVGDSVRGSLRELVEARLGRIEQAVLSSGFVREELAEELAGDTGREVAPIIVSLGSAVHAETGARTSRVQVLGVDSRFGALYDSELDGLAGRRPGFLYPPAILSEALARELAAEVGDEVLLSVERPAEVPRETLVGREEGTDSIETLRLSIVEIASERGFGGFRLTPEQAAPMNLFLDLRRLQRAFFERDRRGRVNAFLASTAADLAKALARHAEIEDLGLLLRSGPEALTLGSRGFVLADALADGASGFAARLGAPVQPVITYLANSISIGETSVPYSTVAGIDPPVGGGEFGRFVLTDGEPAPALADDEILLNTWAAEDLSARVGDEVTLTYYELGPRDEITEASATFRLRGVLALAGAAVDPHLTPEFPGMHDAEDISSWEPPFPVELARIGDRDEEYWDLYKSAPKAFVSESTGRRLWASRFGDRTSIRIGAPQGVELAEFAGRLELELPGALGFEAGGLAIRPLRAEGLDRAKGATDFSGLFFALSMFLIASAALLVGLLFRLGIEQRAREVGLLRAVGYPAPRVRWRFLAEGFTVGALGAAVGLLGAVGYAWVMLAGLRTWWLPAIGAPVLFLHVKPVTLLIGWLSALSVVGLTIWLALRKLRKVATPRLLAGVAAEDEAATAGTRAKWTAAGAFTVALALLAWGLATGQALSANVALGVGASLLVGGIAAFSLICGGRAGTAESPESLSGGVFSIGARNSGRNRGRSILSVALIASAVFSLVVAGSNRREGQIDVADLGSGAGGFSIAAETATPIHVDLNDPARRDDLGFDGEQEATIGRSRVLPLRLLPGEDASCLNLYRPEKPRVLGVTRELVERGGFDFQALDTDATDEEPTNAWTLLDADLTVAEDTEIPVIPAIADANSAQWVLHVGLGKDLVIQDERGRDVRLRLVGLLRRSVFRSEVLIAEEHFLDLFPSRTGYGYFLIETEAARPEEVAAGFERALGPFGFDATPTADKLAAYQAVENTYISTFQTLGGLGLVLGTFGLGIVLLRNVLERRGELATLRAFGYRRRLLARMVLAENGYLLLAGLLIGTVAGLAAAAPNIAAASHRFPWSTVLGTLALVLISGMLASSLAVRGTLRTPLLPALKGD